MTATGWCQIIIVTRIVKKVSLARSTIPTGGKASTMITNSLISNRPESRTPGNCEFISKMMCQKVYTPFTGAPFVRNAWSRLAANITPKPHGKHIVDERRARRWER